MAIAKDMPGCNNSRRNNNDHHLPSRQDYPDSHHRHSLDAALLDRPALPVVFDRIAPDIVADAGIGPCRLKPPSVSGKPIRF